MTIFTPVKYYLEQDKQIFTSIDSKTKLLIEEKHHQWRVIEKCSPKDSGVVVFYGKSKKTATKKMKWFQKREKNYRLIVKQIKKQKLTSLFFDK